LLATATLFAFDFLDDGRLILRPLDWHKVNDGHLHLVGTESQDVEETADMLQPPRLALGGALDDVEQVTGIQTEEGPRIGEKAGGNSGKGSHQRL
jgi:hypothetical protein